MVTTDVKATYLLAAATFADLVAGIRPTQWADPGLGDWDVRALAGHASRSLVTVLTYLDQPAESETIASPERYYAAIRELPIAAADIVERGRQAGAALGDDPSATVHRLIADVTTRLATAGQDDLVTTIAGGMRVGAYLPTRTFEFVVHGLDIAAATGLTIAFDPGVLTDAATLAARIAVELGEGPTVLTALTGRGELPPGYSVV